jgi:hypothetical protein
MNSNELRIGNWVLYEGKPTEVDEFFLGAFKHLKAEPIELTVEVLERAGFEALSRERYFRTKSYADMQTGVIVHHYESEDESVINYIHEPNITKELKYLHQLQNLFYCLTGEEINKTLC